MKRPSARASCRAGRAAEQRAIAALEALGARLVTRAHLSRGVADLIAIFRGEVKIVQVKSCSRSAAAAGRGGGRQNGSYYRDRRLLLDLSRELPEVCSCELWLWLVEEGRWEVEVVGGEER